MLDFHSLGQEILGLVCFAAIVGGLLTAGVIFLIRASRRK